MRRLFLCLLILNGLLFTGALQAQAAPLKVAVLPFKINAPGKDLSPLKEGLQDMLTTRLFVPGKITVIPPEEVNLYLEKHPLSNLDLSAAKDIGRQLGADYVLLGSLTTFGKHVSLDAQLIPVKKDAVIPLYVEAPSLDDLIPKLSMLREKALEALTGFPSKQPVPKITATREGLRPTQNSPTPSPKASLNTSPIPEKTIQKTTAQEEGPRPTNKSTASPQMHKGYKYSEIDPWPDYPPEDDDYGAPQAKLPQNTQSTPNSPQKKSFWSKIWPWNWFHRGKKEPALKQEPITPPPPPPPTVEKQTAPSPQTQKPRQAASPGESADQSTQDSWRWY